MNKNGPIIVIGNEVNDQEMFVDVFDELNYPHKIIFFGDALSALEYLTTSHDQPFLILSDIHLPKPDGFTWRDKIHSNEELRIRCQPSLFFTNAGDQQNVIDAYSSDIQGVFTKPNSYPELLRVIRNIVEYWKDCHSLNAAV